MRRRWSTCAGLCLAADRQEEAASPTRVGRSPPQVTDYLPRGDSFETNGFAPVVDGRDMRTTLVDQVAEGRFSDGVPVLLGSNLDEGSIFMELSPPLL